MNTSPSDFCKDLHAGALNFKLFKFPSLDSTNVFLKSNHSIYPDYSVIYTENQTSGHGRFDRKWISHNSKGLTFSVKIPLKGIAQDNWCNLTQVMALSVAELLRSYNIESSIRWPNDILVATAKICGILAEIITIGSDSLLVIGTGLNINERREDFSGLDREATSLFICTGEESQVSVVLEKLLHIFAKLLSTAVVSGFGSLISGVAAILYKPVEPVKVISGDTEYIGTIRGLSAQGRILLDTVNGTVEVISGEITSRV